MRDLANLYFDVGLSDPPLWCDPPWCIALPSYALRELPGMNFIGSAGLATGLL